MIDFEWRAVLPADVSEDVDGLLAEAAGFDAEPGFSTAVPHGPASGDRRTRHLLVTPSSGTVVIAYMRADIDDSGTACLQYVVRPAHRSLGVSTLLFEKLGDPGDRRNWASQGVRALRGWAHGDHPAAARMCHRFGAVRRDEVHKVLRPIGARCPHTTPSGGRAVQRAPGPRDRTAGHRRGLAPADREAEFPRPVVLRPDGARGVQILVGTGAAATGFLEPVAPPGTGAGEVRAVLSAGLLYLRDAGARVARMYVGADDRAVLPVSRELGFVHDQSDVLYELRP